MNELDEMIQALELTIADSEPMSQRARVLTSMQRFVERGQRVLQSRERREPPLRQVAVVLELRDMARTEQTWIDSLMREEVFGDDHRDVLHFYKAHLAQVEATSMMSVAYIDTDKETTEEAGWWAETAGAQVVKTIALVEHLIGLPEQRRQAEAA